MARRALSSYSKGSSAQCLSNHNKALYTRHTSRVEIAVEFDACLCTMRALVKHATQARSMRRGQSNRQSQHGQVRPPVSPYYTCHAPQHTDGHTQEQVHACAGSCSAEDFARKAVA